MKKEHLSESAKEFNKKSDTELIDFICDNHPTPGEGAKAILDQRNKKSLQYLTDVIQTNNTNAKRHNKIIGYLTIVMVVIAFITLLIVYQQYQYTELATRGDRINQKATILEAKERCNNEPNIVDSGLYNLDGVPMSCEQVLRKQSPIKLYIIIGCVIAIIILVIINAISAIKTKYLNKKN